MITIQTKIKDASSIAYLLAFGQLFARILHRLFVDLYKKSGDVNELKSSYQQTYGINARQYNSIKNQLDAKVKARKAHYKRSLDKKSAKIKALERLQEKNSKKIAQIQKNITKIKTHQQKVQTWRESGKGRKPKLIKTLKTLRLTSLDSELARITNEIKMKQIRLKTLQKEHRQTQQRLEGLSICFGSESLMRNRHNLHLTPYDSSAEWRQAWELSRQGESFWVGSKSETNGNLNAQYCPLTKQLALRVPPAWEERYGTKIYIPLEFNEADQERLEAKLEQGGAITYRFVEKIAKTRRGKLKKVLGSNGIFEKFETELFCLASFEPVATEPVTTSFADGAIGIDFNADHLAVVETDVSGNPINNYSLPYNFKDKSTHQRRAILGDLIADIVDHSKTSGKSISYESLDLDRRKTLLREQDSSPFYRRMISEYAYSNYQAVLISRCQKMGVQAKAINPAFTSVIGAAKFAGYTHLSLHECAALAIARRALGYSERPKAHKHAMLPVRIAGPTLVSAPDQAVKPLSGHVWRFWLRHCKDLRLQIREYNKIQRTVKSIGARINPRRPSGLRAIVSFLSDDPRSHSPDLLLNRLYQWQNEFSPC